MNTNSALVRVVALATSMVVLTAATNLIYGTSADDTLVGTPYDDTINGLAGADTMTGLAGNDRYIVDNFKDKVVEAPGGGKDTIRASISQTRFPANVENLVLTGSANISGWGNALNNRMTGNSGSNSFAGGAGYDTLLGGGGTDRFYFYYPYSRPDVDRLPDFNVAETIWLRGVYEGWPGISAPDQPDSRPLSSSEFHVGAFATTASQRILYDPTTGKLRHDADGTGPLGQIVFAILPTGLALTAGNVWVASVDF